ncbi:MAG: ABC transporter ATP-binding protein [Chloroflexi bacterium]|nr:ABC transporter ATP-binding protein [Chloroflexota bacterium]
MIMRFGFGWGGGRGHEPPREHGGLRNLPRLMRTAFLMVWEADRRRAIEAYSLQLVLGVATGIQLLITRNLIAAVLDPQVAVDPSPLVLQLVAMVLVETTSQFVSLYQQQQQQVLMEQIQRRAGLRVVDVASQVDMAQFDTPEFQDRLTRAQQAMGRLFQVTFSTIGLVRNLATILGVAVALFLLEPLLLLVIVIGFVPTWITSMAISRRVHQFTWEMTPNDRKRGYVMSLFTGRDQAKEVRVFGLTRYLRALYERLSDERLARLIQHLKDRARLSFVGSLGSSLLQAVGYGLLAYLALTGELGLPEAGAAAAAAGQLRGGLGGLVGSASQLYESSLFLYDAEIFLGVLSTLRLRRGTAPAPERFERITVEHVSFSYPSSVPSATEASEPPSPMLGGPIAVEVPYGGPGRMASPDGPPAIAGDGRRVMMRRPHEQRPALRDASLEIGAGEVVALVGENGSGKTTLAKVLSGLYRPDGGHVRWDGIDVASIDPDRFHERVAVLFQDFARFMLTAKENIGLGRVERIEDIEAIVDAAERSGADRFIREWEAGYDTVLGPVFVGGKDISIGQWQRIALARAFFRDAPLVILDEPTAALDARAEHDLFDRMHELFVGRAVLLISHRFSSVRSADRIYVMHEGEIVEQGTHAELMAIGGRYAELFTMQAKAYFPEEYGDARRAAV